MSGHVPEWLTKTDVAKRQIAAAIRMFFERHDPVVTHAVVSAAHQILTDLCKDEGKTALLRGPQHQGKGKKYYEDVNFAANFLKHADRDPKGRINIAPLDEMTAEFLMDVPVCPRWVCESHPDKPYQHDDCGGAGMPCRNPDCVAGRLLHVELDARRHESEPQTRH